MALATEILFMSQFEGVFLLQIYDDVTLEVNALEILISSRCQSDVRVTASTNLGGELDFTIPQNSSRSKLNIPQNQQPVGVRKLDRFGTPIIDWGYTAGPSVSFTPRVQGASAKVS